MPFGNRPVRWLREPLVHFLIAGLLVFGVYAVRGAAVDIGDRKIIVSAADSERLAATWTQTWQRPPSATELGGMIDDYVKEEIYYREALRLGLDRGDPIVRRRLRSKMEFLAAAEIESVVPSDAELQAVLDASPKRYAADPIFTFDQVYISLTPKGEDASDRAAVLLRKLRAGAEAGKLGDTISLPRTMANASRTEIARQFGDAFADALKPLPIGDWAGPLVSGFGLHLVRLRSVAAPGRPALADVRRAVENDWRNATREKRQSDAYKVLRDGYSVEIDRP